MKMVTKVKVTSSWAVQDVTYDDTTKSLTVHMREGTQGQGKRLMYSPVPRHVFDEFLSAESKGRFFNARIRNSYTYVGEV